MWVILIVLIATAAAQPCSPYVLSCAASGGSCTVGATGTALTPITYASCPKNAGEPFVCAACPAGEYCNAGTCASVTGKSCVSGADCLPLIPSLVDAPLACVLGVCSAPTTSFAAHGDSCSASTQCIGAMTCTNSTCHNPGSACTTSRECPVDAFCTAGACVPRSAIGATCARDPTYECALGGVCVSGLCQPAFSGSIGSDCSAPGQSDIACLSGLQCARSSNNTFECGLHPTFANKACLAGAADECSASGAAACLCSRASFGGGECFATIPRSICTGEHASFVACVRGAGCHYDPALTNARAAPEPSCIYRECLASYAAYISCRDPDYRFVSDACGTVNQVRSAAGLPVRLAPATSNAAHPSIPLLIAKWL